mgnify:CR=1 FL=1
MYPLLGLLCCCVPEFPRKRSEASVGDNEEPLVAEKKTVTIGGKEYKKKAKKPKKNNVGESATKEDPLA